MREKVLLVVPDAPAPAGTAAKDGREIKRGGVRLGIAIGEVKARADQVGIFPGDRGDNAENEERNPWQPLHVERGFGAAPAR